MGNVTIPDEGQIANDSLSYRDLIEYIDDGTIHIPEFQREFVWTEDKIIDLLDSIYRNYPIGSLIFWVTSEEFPYSAAIRDEESESSDLKYRLFVIDGQQRLKSLYHAARAKELVMESGTKEINIAFDLNEDRFVLSEDIRDRWRSMYYMPGLSTDDLLVKTLEAIKTNSWRAFRERAEINENTFESLLFALVDIGLASKTDENEYILTTHGETALKNQDYRLIANMLVENAKYIKETLQIIKDNPGISRPDAAPLFQEVYGTSESNAYDQFGRRSKWLRTLQLVDKNNGDLHITDLGEQVLDDIAEREREINLRYIPLERILAEQLDRDFMMQFSDEQWNKIEDVRETFRDYEFSIITVNKADWGRVCDIFERINTQGQQLSIVDLMVAKTWSGQDFNLRDELHEFKSEIGEELPDKVILQALAINITGQCRRQDILGLDSSAVRKEWEPVLESIRKAIDFLNTKLSVPTLDLLPYHAQIVPLSRFYYLMESTEPSKTQTETIERWFWKSAIANRYDSAVATGLEEDAESMKQLVNGEPVSFQYSYIQRTVEDVMNQEYTLRNAFVKTIICLLASKEPLNPINNTPVSHDSFSKYNQTEMHHIFPRNYLEEQEVDEELIDSVANIMFLPANINNSSEFSNAPSEYLEQIDNPDLEEALDTHLISSLEESGIMEDNYETFLQFRARRILNELEILTGEEEIFGQSGEMRPETPFSNELEIRQLIRGSQKYIYWFDKYFTRPGLEWLIEEVDTDSIDQIQILTGTPQTDHNLRSDFEDFKEELANEDVNVEMRVISGETVADIHDRYLITETDCYNIPSVNTIGRGQYAEISRVDSKPEFEQWWEEGYDILSEWNDIQKVIS